MSYQNQKVFVIDESQAGRESLCRLFESAGYEVCCYESVFAFFDSYEAGVLGCLILNVRTCRTNGPDFQDFLFECNLNLPLIVITTRRDVFTAVRAMKAGAFDYLLHPCSAKSLLDRTQKALELCREHQLSHDALLCMYEELQRIQMNHRQLTPREQEVASLVVAGGSSKSIAADLGLSPKTIEAHRVSIMFKMQVGSLSQLVREWVCLDMFEKGLLRIERRSESVRLEKNLDQGSFLRRETGVTRYRDDPVPPSCRAPWLPGRAA